MYTIVESTSAHIWDNSEVVDDNNNREEQEAEEGRRNFETTEWYLREMHDIVVEQRDLNNFRWINNIKNKFNTVFRIVDDINQYNRHTTNPRTWRDHNQNTLYYHR